MPGIHPIHESQESPPTSLTPQMASAIDCCESGDLVRLKALLAAPSTVEPNFAVQELFVMACKARQPHVVRFLIEQFPDMEMTQQLHSAAFSGGIEIYGTVLEKYPTLKDHSFGHTSDPISEAVLNEDIKMLDFLLTRGFEAKESHYCYVPVLVFAREQDAPDEIIERLKQHGATEELPL